MTQVLFSAVTVHAFCTKKKDLIMATCVTIYMFKKKKKMFVFASLFLASVSVNDA